MEKQSVVSFLTFCVQYSTEYFQQVTRADHRPAPSTRAFVYNHGGLRFNFKPSWKAYLTYWSLHRRAGAMTVFQIRKVEFSNMNNLNIEPGHLWQEEDTSEEPREGRGGQQQDSGRSFWLDEQKWKWNDCLECLKGSLSSPSCWHREPRGRRCWLWGWWELQHSFFKETELNFFCFHSTSLIIAVF